MAEKVVGDIIDVEHGTDLSGTATWTKVGETRGEVTYNSNVNVAETVIHSKKQMDKAPTNEAWEMSFEHLVLATLGGLSTLGILDSNNKLRGYRELDTDEGYRITVYEDQDAKDAGTVKLQIQTTDAFVVWESGTITDDDYSAGELTVHSRERFEVTASQ